ncbi:acetyltransferase [Desulfothermus naphthae]
MEITEIYIYGASGHGKVVLDVALRLGLIVKGFVDDDKIKKNLLDYPVFLFNNVKNYARNFALGIGNNKIREAIFEKLKKNKLNIVSLIDPNSILSTHVAVGEGTVIFANAVINSSTTLGKGCIINTSAVVEHDCHIGDFVHISPNASLAGGVKIGKYTQIGIGACVKQNIIIGKNVLVGAGAVIVENIPDNVIVVGNPGRIIKTNE